MERYNKIISGVFLVFFVSHFLFGHVFAIHGHALNSHDSAQEQCLDGHSHEDGLSCDSNNESDFADSSFGVNDFCCSGDDFDNCHQAIVYVQKQLPKLFSVFFKQIEIKIPNLYNLQTNLFSSKHPPPQLPLKLKVFSQLLL